jgi:hypothetical protein
MTNEQAKAKAFQTLSTLTVESVKELVEKLFINYDGNAIAPLEWALEYLESLMPEADFVSFCDEL